MSERMHPLLRHVLAAIRPPGGVAAGTSLLVAVSGGADSIALLHALAALRILHPLHLSVAHVDHGLRPEAAAGEERLVRMTAARLDLPCHVLRVDVNGRAARDHLSLEHAAREERYTALRSLARQLAAPYLAVGHTADDQAENLLLRLLRGAGRKGLAGMPPRTEDLLRPLLQVNRAEVLDYLQSVGAEHLEDRSNDNPRFWRNRLRHHTLPLLERHFGPGTRRALLRSAAILAEEDALLAQLTRQLLPQVVRPTGASWHLDAVALSAQHPALQRRLLEQLCWQMGVTPRNEHILALLRLAGSARNGAELHLGQGLRAGRCGTEIICSFPAGRGPWRGRLHPAHGKETPLRRTPMAPQQGFQHIDAQQLRAYCARQPEGSFLLVDVRQPGEYAAGHLPGALLLPLPELGNRLEELPVQRELVLYCRSGRRSEAAAVFLAGTGRSWPAVYNLSGGILAWQGAHVEGLPALKLFAHAGDRQELLRQAMNLEKGAWRLYRMAAERFAGAPWASVLAQLGESEEAHARVLYQGLSAAGEIVPPFAEMFDALDGELLEGGMPLAEALRQLDALSAEDRLQVVELALAMELAAYDLYRVLAERWRGTSLEADLLSLAQAEKGHLELAARALQQG